MAKAFSVASWNVEHFQNNPDVFSLYEVESGDVYNTIVQKIPEYQFHITEGPQTQEILVGAKRTLTAFFTQKVEFKSRNTYCRADGRSAEDLDRHLLGPCTAVLPDRESVSGETISMGGLSNRRVLSLAESRNWKGDST